MIRLLFAVNHSTVLLMSSNRCFRFGQGIVSSVFLISLSPSQSAGGSFFRLDHMQVLSSFIVVCNHWSAGLAVIFPANSKSTLPPTMGWLMLAVSGVLVFIFLQNRDRCAARSHDVITISWRILEFLMMFGAMKFKAGSKSSCVSSEETMIFNAAQAS